MSLRILRPPPVTDRPPGLMEVDSQIDLVAVHGLHGDPINTWKHPKSGAVWLRDFLPHIVPDARVMTFGYNATAAFGNSIANIRDHAKGLLSSLQDSREDGAENRPLIFIAHSLGGIVVKQALVIAHQDPQYSSIRDSTLGIFFFATPHRGSEKVNYGIVLESIANCVLRQPDSNLLAALKSNSDELNQLTDQFRHQSGRHHIVTLYETVTMPGFTSPIVEGSSALLGIEKEDQLPINADHSSICKIEHATDGTLDKVCMRIARMRKKGFLGNTQKPSKFQVAPCLDAEPYLAPELFVGRAEELEEMNRYLKPAEQSSTPRHLRLSLTGVGGVGKTQIAAAYIRKYGTHYTSIFWLDATSEQTIKTSMQTIAQKVLKPEACKNLTFKEMLLHIKQWLSEPENKKWLLVLDNHDEPDSYRIETYFPHTTHGSIIITSRRGLSVTDHHISILPLQSQIEQLQILATRSGRQHIQEDMYALKLVRGLEGLPLALATAGAYLRINTNVSFKEYFDKYERGWNPNPRQPVHLADYQYRTLYTTWDISFRFLQDQDPDAGKLLKLLAYFHNRGIDYSLLRGGIGAIVDERMSWLRQSLENEDTFDNIMSVLVGHCLVEAHENGFGLHPCVHAWTLASANREVDPLQFFFAAECIGQRLFSILHSFSSIEQAVTSPDLGPLVSHALRLAHPKIGDIILAEDNHRGRLQLPPSRFKMLHRVGHLQLFSCNTSSALNFLTYSLLGMEEMLGYYPIPSHIMGQLETVANLFHEQGAVEFADALHQQLVHCLIQDVSWVGFTDRTDRLSISKTVENAISLADIYSRQGKLEAAEEVFKDNLRRAEAILPAEDLLISNLAVGLGGFYQSQDRFQDAAILLARALNGYNKHFGIGSLQSAHVLEHLGYAQLHRGKHAEAMQHLNQALEVFLKVYGPDYLASLHVIQGLARCDMQNRKFGAAERKLQQVLIGFQKLFGEFDKKMICLISELSIIMAFQYKFEDAEKYLRRALTSIQDDKERLQELDYLLRLWICHQDQHTQLKAPKLALSTDQQSRTTSEYHLGIDDPYTKVMRQMVSEMQQAKGPS